MLSYTKLEKELAELLGWTNISESAKWGKPPNTPGIQSSPLPHWCSYDAAAFQLMEEHRVEIHYCEDWAVSTYIKGNCSGVHCDYAAFPTKADALRCAIVESVIMKLKEPK